jgi:hypothetical protein
VKFFVGTSVAFVAFGAVFGGSLFGGNTALLAFSFCGLSGVVYPMMVVAIYRIFSGRTDKGVVIVSKDERAILDRYRRRAMPTDPTS